ncbi:EF-hand calcium-binding domain-containing protein 10-like [Dendronephthya gigantea]|uniref:EF-hand calcium-binding domain-containing protein 10-like n=1 Tax=Dendronephthya gigantea TaxID=151771 RepID=UPI00106D9002|nr:EF-hand calcium-binding domain-containing protein 10-like [Dendronephthya gigantea]
MDGKKEKEERKMEDIAEQYLKKHKILALFENITARLVFERPENPRTLMRDHIRNLMESREFDLDFPCLFDSSNIKCLFGILDASCGGHIIPEQFRSALEVVGASIIQEDDVPDLLDNDGIPFDVFLTKMREGISNSSATFAPDF